MITYRPQKVHSPRVRNPNPQAGEYDVTRKRFQNNSLSICSNHAAVCSDRAFNWTSHKMSEGKHTLWSSEEISVLLAIWSSSEIQEKLERSKKKQIVYDEISQEMMNGGFNRSSEQIVNKLKKLRKEYRDLKMKPSKRGRGGLNKKTFDHGVMESILGDRPCSHFTRALNSATATVETNPESPVCSGDELGELPLFFSPRNTQFV